MLECFEGLEGLRISFVSRPSGVGRGEILMLLVKTRLKRSSLHGLGVFAAEFIPRGAVVWKYVEGVDHRLSAEFVESLPDPARSAILHYCALWGGGYVVSADNARFLNHSETPNLRTVSAPDIDIAIREIYEGEELTEDYREFDENFPHRTLRHKPIALGLQESARRSKS